MVVALEIADDTTCDQFQITLRRGEADKRTPIDQRRTRDTAMHLLGTIVEEGLHIIPQLRTAHNGVVADHNTLILQQSRVRNQLHLGHQRTALLITRCKRARPRGRIFQHRAVVGHTLSLSIAQGHADTRIRHATHAVDLRIVLLTHHLTILLTHHFHVDAVIV